MPIAVRVVSDEDFAAWLDSHKKSASKDDAGKVATARN
jgi:heme/copper-type cytochrome/quinol oxidase subunit 2